MHTYDCSKLCVCGTLETKTEVILYPILEHKKNIIRQNNRPHKSRNNINHKQKRDNTQNQSKLRSTEDDQEGHRSARILQTISLVQNINMCSKLQKRCPSTNLHSEEKEAQTMREHQNKQNFNENNQLDKKKTRKQSLIQFSQMNPVQLTSRSSILSAQQSDMTIRLLQKGNMIYDDQLQKLKQQEKHLIKLKEDVIKRNKKEIKVVREKKKQMQRKSFERKAELEQLVQLLSIVKRKRYI